MPKKNEKEVNTETGEVKAPEKHEAESKIPQEKNLTEIYAALSAPFPPEAVQRTKGDETHKGYDTTGIGYQWIVNRLNEVCGLDGWGYDYKILNESIGEFANKKPRIELTVETSIWISAVENSRACIGGHIASNYADAYKGAITNALKKTAAFWGVGKQAYEGTLDDDAKLPADAAQAHTAGAYKSPAPAAGPQGTLAGAGNGKQTEKPKWTEKQLAYFNACKNYCAVYGVDKSSEKSWRDAHRISVCGRTPWAQLKDVDFDALIASIGTLISVKTSEGIELNPDFVDLDSDADAERAGMAAGL